MPATDFSSIRQVRMGSSAIGERLLEQVKTLFPNARLQNSYGTTEAGPIVFGPRGDGKQPPLGAAGWPMPDVEVRLVDENCNDAERGVLLMRSPVNMKGYLNLPDETKAVLSPDGWYCTGDIFRRDEEGAYWFVSRNDDMFNCGGENIYPQQVERMLEAHPSVVEVCVVPVPDELKGAKPFAFVVRRPGHVVTEAELKTYTLAHGPAYQHPRWICFVDSLPLASTNKVNRRALKKRALEIAANAGGDEARILMAGNS